MQYPERGKAERMLGYKDLKTIIGASRWTIARWVKAGTFPPHDIMLNTSPKWLDSTVANWIEKKKAKPLTSPENG